MGYYKWPFVFEGGKMPEDAIGHACGISAICAPGTNMAYSLFLGHSWMQLRGQESAGIVLTDGDRFRFHGGLGLVTDVFGSDFLTSDDNGSFRCGIGHNRYSTTGSNKAENVQPIHVVGPSSEIFLGHNGDLTNVTEILPFLERKGIHPFSTMDSELIAHLIVHASGDSWAERIAWAMTRLRGSYCISVLTHQGVYVARDPMGNRPLSVGQVPGGYAAASSSMIFDVLHGEFIREVNPGEIVQIGSSGVEAVGGVTPAKRSGGCPFESIYFSAPDDMFWGKRALDVRRQAGALTARRLIAKPARRFDLVVGVPDSGLEAARGVSEELRLPLDTFAFRKNPAARRTFIEPQQEMRSLLGMAKYYARREELEGKRVLVVDDSTIRLNAVVNVLDALVAAGVKEIHLLFTWWPVRRPCPFGIDMYTRKELPASEYDSVAAVEGALVERYKGKRVSTVTFATPEIIARAIGLPQDAFCTGCWSGEYPEEVRDPMEKGVLERALA